jgi:hypothetical protein
MYIERCDSARGWVLVAYLSNFVALAPDQSSAFGDGFEEGCFSDIVTVEEWKQKEDNVHSQCWKRAVSFDIHKW